MSVAEKRDYYEVLGVGRDAGDAAIKAAYRKLALQYHPDRNQTDPQAEERFKEASEAYSILSDGQKRSQYDRFGHAAFQAGGGNGGGAAGFGDFADIFGDIFGLGDLFGQAGGGRRGRRAQRGSDLRYDLDVTFEEVLQGVDKTLKFTRLESCDECSGRGTRGGTPPATCSSCGGQGQVRMQQGFFAVARTCSTCSGTGTVVRDACPRCRGRGRIEKTIQKPIHIPAGVEDGVQLRVSGEGEAGANGGPHGDLYVVLKVAPHPHFERKGADLLCVIPLSFPQAALGCEIEVPTPWGREKVKIPAGTQSGASLAPLRGKGLPRLQGRGRGDLHIRVQVEVPTRLTREQRAHLEELKDLMPHSNQPHERGSFDKVSDFFA